MDPRLAVIGAGVFAAIVAVGGWSVRGGASTPSPDPSPLSTVSAPAITGQSPADAPTPTIGIPPVRNREREHDGFRDGGVNGTPGPRPREHDDD